METNQKSPIEKCGAIGYTRDKSCSAECQLPKGHEGDHSGMGCWWNDASCEQPPVEVKDLEKEFRWQHIVSPQHLTEFYETILPKIHEAARQCGYAIAVHGSLKRDMDLIAVPWIGEHSDEQMLCKSIHKAACGLVQESYQIGTEKPHGRLTTMFPVCWIDYPDPANDGTGHIDLSIMPSITESNTPLLLEIEELKQANHAANELIGAQAQENDKINQGLLRKIEELEKVCIEWGNSCKLFQIEIQKLQSQIAVMDEALILARAYVNGANSTNRVYEKIDNALALTNDGSELGEREECMNNPQHHFCPDCGYVWQHGKNGSHSCVAILKQQLSTSLELLEKAKGAIGGKTTYGKIAETLTQIETFLKENER